MRFDISLDDRQIQRLSSIPQVGWFDQVHFLNASSPRFTDAPDPDPYPGHEYKAQFVGDWIKSVAPGATVLDAFCANGEFSFLALECGASRVEGVDFSRERVEAARFVADALRATAQVSFMNGDIYEIGRLVEKTFDVVLCLGGLYHVADPPYILRQLRSLTDRWLIVQTSHILPWHRNRAHFVIRSDMTAEGCTSIRGGSGVWYLTAGCFRRILEHGGFEIVEERQPPRKLRRFVPWYAALCRPM